MTRTNLYLAGLGLAVALNAGRIVYNYFREGEKYLKSIPIELRQRKQDLQVKINLLDRQFNFNTKSIGAIGGMTNYSEFVENYLPLLRERALIQERIESQVGKEPPKNSVEVAKFMFHFLTLAGALVSSIINVECYFKDRRKKWKTLNNSQ